MPKLDDDTRRGLHPLTANHELNETNLKKFKHGNDFAMVQGHGHYGLHGIHDVSTVNTMNESPNAQKIFRDMRKDEIDDAIKTSPALKRVLEPMSEGQRGFENRISQRASELAREHAEHNQKVLSRVPERLHSHPAVQARLKTVDAGELAELAERSVRKSGRLNRHMLRHVGKVAVQHKVPEKLRELKLVAKRGF